MKHTITTDHRVVTVGSRGQIIAVTRWHSTSEAAEFAQRMAAVVGGTVHIQTAA